jgi:hypothetical protein
MNVLTIARVALATTVLAVLNLPAEPSGASAALVSRSAAARTAIAAANIGGEGARVLGAVLDQAPRSPRGVIPSISWVVSLRPYSARVKLDKFTAVVDAHTGKLMSVDYVGWVAPNAGSVREKWPLLHLRTLPDADIFGDNFLLYKSNVIPKISRSRALQLFRATRIGRAASVHEMMLARVWSTNWGPAQGHVLSWLIAADNTGLRWYGELPSPYIYTMVDAQTGEVVPILACGIQPSWK